jgi:hypothetical protein
MENELLNSKKQCLDLTEEINRLTREVQEVLLEIMTYIDNN